MNSLAYAEYQRLTKEAFKKQGLSQPQRATLLRHAAALALPAACRAQVCESDARACRSRHKDLSPREQRDCLNRLFVESNACKFEAQAAARGGGFSAFRAALPRWIEAENAGAAAAALDPTPLRVRHAHYLAYWRYLTAAWLALHDADFTNARGAFSEARRHADHLSDQTYPLYSSKELAAEDIYIDAISSVKAKLFNQAAASFERWLALFPERQGTLDLRFDSVRANHIACVILDQVLTGIDSTESLDTLARHLRSTNVSLPTWTLWTRVRGIAAAAQLVPASVRSVIDGDNSLWILFLQYTALDEPDKSSGQARSFNLPRFLDMFMLTSDRHDWAQILAQNLRNALYVLVDYEQFRHNFPPDDEKELAALDRVPTVSDDLRTEELLRIVRRYLERRNSKLLPACDRASALLAEFSDASRLEFGEASEIHRKILESFRLPHVVVVEDIEAVDEARGSRTRVPRRSAKLNRLWNREPRHMNLQTPQTMEKGEYYYLRPTWNTRLQKDCALSLGEQLGRATAARWVDAFWRGLFLPHKVDATTFAEWILQFRPSERRFASLLFDALDFYDEERVRHEWIQAFQQLPLSAKRDPAFIGLGHGAKSGQSQRYYFRQGIKKLPEYLTLYGGKEKVIFRDLSEFVGETHGLRRPSAFVFIDDFIGTGGQASDFINWYFRRDEYKFLTESDVFLMVLAGFDDGIKVVQDLLRSKISGAHLSQVIAAKILKSEDRAFSESSRIWRDTAEARRAMEWAAEVGEELLASDPTLDSEGRPLYNPREDRLGWHGCQALVSFHYNIPSDTIPIFWSTGTRGGKPWVPLQKRTD